MQARLPVFRTPSKHRIEGGVMFIENREICLVNTVAGKAEYSRRTQAMAARQEWKCAICTRILNPSTFDHMRSRSGGKQDDRIEDENGNPMNAALCYGCQSVKGSARYEFRDGQYVPALKAP